MRIELSKKEMFQQYFVIERAVAGVFVSVLFIGMVQMLVWHIYHSAGVLFFLFFVAISLCVVAIWPGLIVYAFYRFKKRKFNKYHADGRRGEFTRFKKSGWWKPILMFPSGIPIIIRFMMRLELWEARKSGFPQYFYCPKRLARFLESAQSVTLLPVSGSYLLLEAIEINKPDTDLTRM